MINQGKNQEHCREYCCNILLLFGNTRGLWHYVVRITMHAQFVVICNSYCNATKMRQKSPYYNQYMLCCNTKPCFFATISGTSATSQNCRNICLNITTKMYFVAIPSLYCNKMTHSRNGTLLSQ